MTNCMINVDWAWHVASKQPERKSRRLCCLGGVFIDVLSMFLSTLTIYDNSGALSGANCRSILLKPKFHYADFATKSKSPGQVPDKVTDLSRTQIMKVFDTNHVANFHDLCRGLSWFVSAKKSVDFVADFVADFPRAL